MALLAGGAPRSEHDPDLVAAAAVTVAMHPVTGAFVNPTHESAFAAQLYRLAFPCHLLLLALPLAVLVVTALPLPPGVKAREAMLALPGIFALVGRVLVHRMHDKSRAQRMGSWTWTAMAAVPMSTVACRYATSPAAQCKAAEENPMYLLWVLAFALVNGSHGMGFTHKTALIGALLLLNLSAVGACGVALGPRIGLSSAVAIVGFIVAHLIEMKLRETYAEKVQDTQRLEEETAESRRLEERMEQLQAEKERLWYDVQRRGSPLDDGDDRSAIRRGLQAGPSQPNARAGSTELSERGAPAPVDSPPPSLPPGAPSSSAGESSASPTAPPSTWASSTAGAPSSSFGQSTVPPPSWAELAYRRFYAERAAQSSTDPGLPPPMGQPPTWVELGAEPDRQWHEERARVVALAASSASGAEATSGQEVVEELVAEMATQEEEAASAGTVCIRPPGFVTAQRP